MSKIAPSILASDFSRLGEAVAFIGECGCDMVHVDVMDGHFVPNITLGPMIVKAIRPYTDTFFDVHLMISDPEKYAPQYIEAGADSITVHAEVLQGEALEKMIDTIHSLGAKAAVAINPDTPVSAIENVLDKVDMVLCMTVFPGFGGQKLIPSVLEKVAEIRARYPKLDIQVDGGVNDSTIEQVNAAGANVLVMGTGFFKAAEPLKAVESVHALDGGMKR